MGLRWLWDSAGKALPQRRRAAPGQTPCIEGVPKHSGARWGSRVSGHGAAPGLLTRSAVQRCVEEELRHRCYCGDPLHPHPAAPRNDGTQPCTHGAQRGLTPSSVRTAPPHSIPVTPRSTATARHAASRTPGASRPAPRTAAAAAGTRRPRAAPLVTAERPNDALRPGRGSREPRKPRGAPQRSPTSTFPPGFTGFRGLGPLCRALFPCKAPARSVQPTRPADPAGLRF